MASQNKFDEVDFSDLLNDNIAPIKKRKNPLKTVAILLAVITGVVIIAFIVLIIGFL